MSRIGNQPVTIPSGVTVTKVDNRLVVKGPKGELSETIPAGITPTIGESSISFKRANDEGQTKAYHGLIRSLVQNMIEGVSKGYIRKLELVGTGYRAKKRGSGLTITAGYSHPVEVEPREGITLETEGDTVIVVSGFDKQKIGQTAAEIRAIRKPEPYKGKGIRYQGEVIRRKAGKAAKAGA